MKKQIEKIRRWSFVEIQQMRGSEYFMIRTCLQQGCWNLLIGCSPEHIEFRRTSEGYELSYSVIVNKTGNK